MQTICDHLEAKKLLSATFCEMLASYNIMGQIYQEVYLVKICHFFSKFEPSILENGRLWRLKFPPPVLVSQSSTSRHIIWDPICNSRPSRWGQGVGSCKRASHLTILTKSASETRNLNFTTKMSINCVS